MHTKLFGVSHEACCEDLQQNMCRRVEHLDISCVNINVVVMILSHGDFIKEMLICGTHRVSKFQKI